MKRSYSTKAKVKCIKSEMASEYFHSNSKMWSLTRLYQDYLRLYQDYLCGKKSVMLDMQS